MARETPTLGYPSRTAAAVALRAEGLTEAAIAERIGVSRNAISGLLANARDAKDAPQLGRGTLSGNAHVLAAKRAGIMLSHEVARPLHRPTSDGSMRVIDLKLPEAQFAKLIDMARKANATPSAYANSLFQVAYTARCAPTGDRDLEEAVGSAGTPAETLQIQEQLARADARIAELIDEVEQLAAAEARLQEAEMKIAELRSMARAPYAALARELEITKASLTEAKAQAVTLGDRLEAAQAGQTAAERRAHLFADQADEAVGGALALQEALQALGEEIGVEPGSERIVGLRAVFAQQAEAIRELMARVAAMKSGEDTRSAPPQAEAAPQPMDMVEKAKGTPYAADGNLSPAFVRSCVGFAAVSQTPAWIAKTMRADIADVRRALERRR